MKATKLKRCDFAHLAATRWPLAGFKELYILAFLSLWLVTWDDQIDDDTKDSLSNDFEAAEQYRRETLYFVAQCLDLDLTKGLPRSYNDSIFVPDDPIVQSFDVIGEALRDAYTYGSLLLLPFALFFCLFPEFEMALTRFGLQNNGTGFLRRCLFSW